MDNQFSYQEKCLSSCPYNLSDDISSVPSNDSNNDLESYDSEHPPILENYEIPKPYIFRIKAPSRTGQSKLVTCPPFYLQLDHVIAVIWQLFDPDKKKNWTLGIGQLQWALYFLKAIKDPTEGKRSPDVELVIRSIEDALLECYADMASVVMRSPPPQGIPCILCNLERYIPKSTCQLCTTTSWSLLGQPRKSGQGSKLNSNTDFNNINNISFIPHKPIEKQDQTDDQLKTEIDNLKNLASSLSSTKTVDLRKKVQVKSFTVLGL